MSNEDEHLLVDRIIAGQAALLELWLALAPLVKGVIRYYLRSNNDVDDLAQEIFIKFSAQIGSYRREGELRAWMYRIVKNHCLDYLKKNGRLSAADPLEDQPLVDPIFSEHMMNQLIEANEAFSSMTPREQDVVRAKLEGWEKDAEVAEHLGLSYDQVRGIIRSLRRKMGRGNDNSSTAKAG
jgi:RNA polymerase sigma-70 factor (ECF subfamily)